MDKKEQARLRKQRQRDRERDKSGGNVTLGQEKDVTQHHPVMYALVDPVKRKKLQAICNSLSSHSVLDKVYYGCGIHALSMDVVNDLLDTTESH